jgi:hypothetical protein
MAVVGENRHQRVTGAVSVVAPKPTEHTIAASPQHLYFIGLPTSSKGNFRHFAGLMLLSLTASALSSPVQLPADT